MGLARASYNMYSGYNFKRVAARYGRRDRRKVKMSSIYEQIGGAAAVERAVDIFYRRMLLDERVASYFETVDMDRQRAKQKAFLTMVLGGPNDYTGKDMRTAHAHLVQRGLNDGHVDLVIEHLGATLKELGASDEQVAAVAAIANSVRNDVLSR
jgi:hemoglobin